MYGNAGNDTFYDTGGTDLIAGGSGTDLLLYWGISSGVTIDLSVTAAQNTGTAGMDTITSIENLTGSGGNDTLSGSSVANVIRGYYGNDTIFGAGGNDTLLGEAGDDTISGGGGIDTASYVNSGGTGVTVDLAITAAQDTVSDGIDTLTSIENLIGSGYDDQLLGNSVANILSGGNGNDFLNGRGGNDVLVGEDGDDILLGGKGDDSLDGGTGTDYASYVGAGSGVTVSLAIAGAQNTVGAGVDTLVGMEGLIGSSLRDHLTGDSASNYLEGGAGNDALTGGAGNDFFRFSAPLNPTKNVDGITDFTHLSDTIQLDAAIFSAAGAPGVLDPNAFYSGSQAHDADDRILYNPVNGNIYYDADGDGAGARVLFAHVTAGLTLSNADFEIVG